MIDQCVASVEEGTPAEADDDGVDEECTEFLPTPQDDETGEPEAPVYRFGHLIDYDLKNKVKRKIEKLTKQCQSDMPDIDLQFDIDQLMADCDLEFQSDCEAMMTELDWATNNYADGAEEVALDEWLSGELLEEGLEADNGEMEMMKKLRLREATAEELKNYTPTQPEGRCPGVLRKEECGGHSGYSCLKKYK